MAALGPRSLPSVRFPHSGEERPSLFRGGTGQGRRAQPRQPSSTPSDLKPGERSASQLQPEKRGRERERGGGGVGEEGGGEAAASVRAGPGGGAEGEGRAAEGRKMLRRRPLRGRW